LLKSKPSAAIIGLRRRAGVPRARRSFRALGTLGDRRLDRRRRTERRRLLPGGYSYSGSGFETGHLDLFDRPLDQLLDIDQIADFVRADQ
jgi:hypothetical protein